MLLQSTAERRNSLSSRSMHSILAEPTANSVEDQLRIIGARAQFNECVQRKRAANMLLVGSISGLLGFIFAFVIGLVKEQLEGKYDVNGNRFKSGRGYFPATVSEMVHDPSKPVGKVFFAFCFVGAVMIFFSWYPTMLRNVYIGDDAQCCRISWVTYRQFIPAPGMMMLSIITTVPAAEASVTDDFCIALHLVGAAMLFVGYFVCEAHCVGWGPFAGCLEDGKLLERRRSIKQRKFCLTGIGFFYSLFIALQVVLQLPVMPAEDYDQWGTLPGHTGIQLVNSATWRVKWLKVASYVSEVLCGLFLIASHLVIWYHSEERHYDLPEALAELQAKPPHHQSPRGPEVDSAGVGFASRLVEDAESEEEDDDDDDDSGGSGDGSDGKEAKRRCWW